MRRVATFQIPREKLGLFTLTSGGWWRLGCSQCQSLKQAPATLVHASEFGLFGLTEAIELSACNKNASIGIELRGLAKTKRRALVQPLISGLILQRYIATIRPAKKIQEASGMSQYGHLVARVGNMQVIAEPGSLRMTYQLYGYLQVWILTLTVPYIWGFSEPLQHRRCIVYSCGPVSNFNSQESEASVRTSQDLSELRAAISSGCTSKELNWTRAGTCEHRDHVFADGLPVDISKLMSGPHVIIGGRERGDELFVAEIRGRGVVEVSSRLFVSYSTLVPRPVSKCAPEYFEPSITSAVHPQRSDDTRTTPSGLGCRAACDAISRPEKHLNDECGNRKGHVDQEKTYRIPRTMSSSTDRNSHSDVESAAPTIVDDNRSKNDPGDVGEVIAPGEESAQEIKDEKGDPFLVQWDGPDDPANPKVRFLHMSLSDQYSLHPSLFVVGYCVGPLLWGPLSENYGRRPIFLIGFVVYTGFQIGGALAPNIASILVFRFLGGTFAACPLTNSGAIIADMYVSQTPALAIFTLAPFAGPALGPTVAGYMSLAGVSWRWLFGVLSIFVSQHPLPTPARRAQFHLISFDRTARKNCASLLVMIDIIAQSKGRTFTGPSGMSMRSVSRFISKSLRRIENILGRPFIMFFQEPMLFAVTLYMSFIYGCVYLLFAAYPIVFTQGHHLNSGASGLMFLPLFGGGIGGVVVVSISHALSLIASDVPCCSTLYTTTRYIRDVFANLLLDPYHPSIA
ncbi:polyamine transporter 1 [Rhizoctonia solani AG-1 IA]|uniref:Polyamine transporter 1 n=1 Tax=Thanatephorus cucumeris (strain AG1-IA) TaxID=983506 RepID=L8WY59_THACA|nr:polyamine transporter 1 [Rhizoctonia solani AG-1 IA]